MSQRESIFEMKLVQDLMHLYPNAIILKTYPNYIQGFPDRLMLLNDRWAAFEIKSHHNARHQPNQDYYIELLNRMSFASFVYPANREEFFNEIQFALRSVWETRVFKRE